MRVYETGYKMTPLQGRNGVKTKEFGQSDSSLSGKISLRLMLGQIGYVRPNRVKDPFPPSPPKTEHIFVLNPSWKGLEAHVF